jgi:hypothetical protein
VLDRTGYGWNEWSRDRIAQLGLQGYIDEQLDPDSISETDNTELNSRMAAFDPPESVVELIGRQVVGGVYARRQLAEQAGSFWANHFNTEWRKVADQFQNRFPQCGTQPQCDPAYPARANLEASRVQLREYDAFRDLSFHGNYREMLEASALSTAMIIFLDGYTNVAASPNENYARELLELYSMGVDGGYTQQDVEQLARVLTGWSYCKKPLADLDDPLAPCINNYWEPTPAGEWVANFRNGQHDCGQKVLFDNTPQETTIASTCGNGAAAAQELQLALDAIVEHPATPRFVSRKILERFVADDPPAAWIDALVDVWNDASNPQGVGDMREVLRAALSLSAFLDPDRARSKIKTPLEHFVSALRATRGSTDGTTEVLSYLTNAQYVPHSNPVPTGYAEAGGEWLSTNNCLDRQNFGIELAKASGAGFGSSIITLLNDNGVATGPGNAAAIVDFFVGALFGGGLTPAERQEAIDFLNTNNSGTPSNYTDSRIRDTVGFLLGYPQFQEQ